MGMSGKLEGMSADGPAVFLLVEDHALEARSIARVLRRYGRVSHARTLAEAAAHDPAMPPTGAVVDWKLPDGDGLTLVASLRRRLPRLPILVLTAHLDPDCVNRAHLLGAEYVIKPASARNLESFARRALCPVDPAPDRGRLAERWARVHGLSPSETEILRLYVTGVDRAEIGERMGISDNTVKTYVKRLLVKCGAESLEAVTRGILEEALGG